MMERDPHAFTPNEPGAKLDRGKAPVMRGAVRVARGARRVDARDAGRSEQVEEIAAHDGADDPQDDVEHKPFTRLVDDLATNEAGDEP